MRTLAKLLCIVVYAACIVLLMSACGDGPVVEYDMTCSDVSCDSATDTSTYADGIDRAYTCTWYCADYDGQDNAYVEIEFWAWEGECFQVESVYTSEGICQ